MLVSGKFTATVGTDLRNREVDLIGQILQYMMFPTSVHRLIMDSVLWGCCV